MDTRTRKSLVKYTGLNSKVVDQLIRDNIHEFAELFKDIESEYYPILKLIDKVINSKSRIAIALIHGLMDDGKTYRMKLFGMWLYRKFKWRFAWLMSNKPAILEEIGKWYEGFITTEHINLFQDTHIIKLNGSDDIWVMKDKNNEDIICYFHTMTSMKKTGRDGRLMNAFFDEYNFGDTRYMNILSRTLQTFISRNLRAGFRMWMIGNSTTYDIPILYEWGIFEPPENEFHIHNLVNQYGKASKSNILIHTFKRKENHFDDKYDDVAMYDVLRSTDFGKHAFDNESLLDNSNHVMMVDELNSMMIQSYETLHTIFSDGVLIDINYVVMESGQTLYYVCNSDHDKKDVKIAFHEDDVVDGIEFEEPRPMELARLFQLNKIYYENIIVKNKIYKIIKRFIRRGTLR